MAHWRKLAVATIGALSLLGAGTVSVGADGRGDVLIAFDSMTPDGVVNVSTGKFPAGGAGDSTINATVDLPHTCKDPIVFVTSPTGSWFAESSPFMGRWREAPEGLESNPLRGLDGALASCLG